MEVLLIDKEYSALSFVRSRIIEGRGWGVALALWFIICIFLSIEDRDVNFQEEKLFLYIISYPLSVLILSLVIYTGYFFIGEDAIEYCSKNEVLHKGVKISLFSFVFYDAELVSQLMYYDDSFLSRLLKLPRVIYILTLFTLVFGCTQVKTKGHRVNDRYYCEADSDCVLTTGICDEQVAINQLHLDAYLAIVEKSDEMVLCSSFRKMQWKDSAVARCVKNKCEVAF